MTHKRTYADLEIRILNRQEAGYPVEITLNNEQQFPRGFLTADFLPWVPGSDPGQDGERLFDWLFADDQLKTAWAEVRGQGPGRRVRLRIDASAPELHAIPWELLRDPGDGGAWLDLAATSATPFSRYLAGRWQPGGPILKRPIKMLAVIANPANLAEFDLAALEVEKEWALLEEATSGLEVELVRLPEPCTLAALEAELKKGYHILHFVGHGSYSQRGEAAALYMADEENRVALVKDADLAAMLARQLAEGDLRRDDKLRLVFLAGCQTAARSPADAFRGLAPQLVAAGVPAVLAMQDLITVETAREFSRVFYQGLLEHGQVDLASNEARAALLTAKKPGAGIPVLFMRLRSGALFGQRGQILGDRAGSFWDTLLENIADGECTPFLGPGVTADLLLSPQELAQTLAAKKSYPFVDSHNLPRVAQFIGTLDNRRLRKDVLVDLACSFQRHMGLKPDPEDCRQGLAATIKAANWSETSQALFETEIHHQLADLGLPLYLTTNFDNFLALALEARGRQPRRETLSWREALTQEARRPQFDLDPPASKDKPVILHLFGTEDDLLSMVLTEDDYLDYLARISRDHQYLLPTSVPEALASTTLLFLGYRLEDLDLKVIMRGLLTNLDLERWNMLHVAVQIEAAAVDEAKNEEVIRYFQKYFSKSKIDVYWGSTQQFVNELHTRWQERHNG